MIYEPNKGYNWEDEKVWEMVNPNLYVSFDITFYVGNLKMPYEIHLGKPSFYQSI